MIQSINMHTSFNHFLSNLQHIARAPYKGKKAPHKPVLPLSLADWFERNVHAGNRIVIDTQLVGIFRENWKLLVVDGIFKADITQPLHYLQTDGFWTLWQSNGEKVQTHHRSVRRLSDRGIFGQLSPDVFRWFSDPVCRELIRMHVLDTFFPVTKINYVREKGIDQLVLDIEADVLMEPASKYGRKIIPQREWEGYIRNHKFRDLVLKNYDDTCCISGFRLQDNPAPIVEACHIRKHAETGLNTIENGLALCLNLHRAFDYGLIGLTNDYKVIVKKDLIEPDSLYSLRQLEGRPILLPAHERYFPNKKYLAWHRERFQLG